MYQWKFIVKSKNEAIFLREKDFHVLLYHIWIACNNTKVLRFDPHCTINSLSRNCLTCYYSQHTYALKYNNGNKLKLKKKWKSEGEVLGLGKNVRRIWINTRKCLKKVNRHDKISMLSILANNFI